jgi:hypothetical protein
MWLIGGREQSIPVEGRVSAAGAARSQEGAMICANPTKFAIHLPADRVRVQFLRSRACSPLDNPLGPRSPSCASNEDCTRDAANRRTGAIHTGGGTRKRSWGCAVPGGCCYLCESDKIRDSSARRQSESSIFKIAGLLAARQPTSLRPPPHEPMSLSPTLASLLAACTTVSAFLATPAGNLCL